MESKSHGIKKAVLNTLKIDVPVVCIENDYEGHQLEMSPEKHQSYLPDYTMQPANLFHAITDLLKMNNDNLGLMTFKHFSISAVSVMTSLHSVPAKIASKEELWKP